MIDIDKAKKIAEVISDGFTFEGMRCFLEDNDVEREELDEFLGSAVKAFKDNPKMTNLEYYMKEAEELQRVRKAIELVRLDTTIDLCSKCPHNGKCNHSTSRLYDSKICAEHLRKFFMDEHREESSE